MIVGLQIGKEKSLGCPGKNYMKILGRQMNEYPLMAARQYVDKMYISTDSPSIKASAFKYDATIIERPSVLATPESLTEDVLLHAYEFIKKDLKKPPEMIILLFANTPMLDHKRLAEAIKILKSDETLDSCFSVAKYNMFSPTRARKLQNNIIDSFVDLGAFQEVSSIRDSQGDVYFVDLSIQVLRSRCLEQIETGQPPFKWMGNKAHGLEIEFGFDIDAEWQIPVAEYWLEKNGFTEFTTPYDT